MKKIITIVAILANMVAFSQVGIGTNTPSAKSILDLTATDKGLLLPRMTTVQRTAIMPNATTDRGMQVYDTTTKTVWFWDGAKWVNTQSVDFDSVYDVNAVPPATGTTGITLYTADDGTTSATLPANAGTAMFIDPNGAAYTWDSTKFVTFAQKASTPWYFAGSITDAGNSKTKDIYRTAKVGIGTFSSTIKPLSILHVRGSNGILSRIEGSTTNSWAALNIKSDDVQAEIQAVSTVSGFGKRVVYGSRTAHDVIFSTNDQTNNPTIVVNHANSNVGIKTNTTVSNADLTLGSTNKGLRLNKVTLSGTKDATTVGSLTAGMTVYNTATAGTGATAVKPGIYYCDGSKWIYVGTSEDFDSVYDVDAVPPATGTTGITLYTADDGTTSATLPANAGTAMFIDPNGAAYTWDGTKFLTFTQKASTPWYIANTTTDAGNNKTKQIERSAGIKLNSSNVSTSVGGLGLSSANTLLALHNKAGGSTGIIMQSDAATPKAFKIGINPTYLSNGVVTFQTKDGAASWADRFAINITTGYIGIGTANPLEKLDVIGKTKTTTFQMTNGASAGAVLVSDASGNAAWDNSFRQSGNVIMSNGSSNTFTTSISSGFITITSVNACGMRMISLFAFNENSIIHISSVAKNAIGSATSLAVDNNSWGVTFSGVTACGDGGTGPQFDFTISKSGGVITLSGYTYTVDKTYNVTISR